MDCIYWTYYCLSVCTLDRRYLHGASYNTWAYKYHRACWVQIVSFELFFNYNCRVKFGTLRCFHEQFRACRKHVLHKTSVVKNWYLARWCQKEVAETWHRLRWRRRWDSCWCFHQLVYTSQGWCMASFLVRYLWDVSNHSSYVNFVLQSCLSRWLCFRATGTYIL